MKYLPGRSHNTKPLSCRTGNRAKVLLKGYLSIRGYPQYNKVIIIIIIIKKEWQCKAGRGRLTPYQSEDPSPTLPTHRGKEEKGKIVEDKKGESN